MHCYHDMLCRCQLSTEAICCWRRLGSSTLPTRAPSIQLQLHLQFHCLSDALSVWGTLRGYEAYSWQAIDKLAHERVVT